MLFPECTFFTDIVGSGAAHCCRDHYQVQQGHHGTEGNRYPKAIGREPRSLQEFFQILKTLPMVVRGIVDVLQSHHPTVKREPEHGSDQVDQWYQANDQ